MSRDRDGEQTVIKHSILQNSLGKYFATYLHQCFNLGTILIFFLH